MAKSRKYDLSSGDSILSHHSVAAQAFIADGDVSSSAEIQALVASGDCFIALATVLDNVSESAASEPIRPELEKVTKTLLYLQRHYEIRRKKPDYRQ